LYAYYSVGSVHPSLKTLCKNYNKGKTSVLNQEIMLRGQNVVAFLTLQMVQVHKVSFRKGEMAIKNEM